MCLAVPGKIIIIEESGTGENAAFFRKAKVSFSGVLKEISLAYVPEARVGDYVLVHVGFAIGTVDEEEAQRVLEYAREMEELAELEESGP